MARPRNWYSWNFSLEGPGRETIAQLAISAWRERGSVDVDGVTYAICRDGLFGPFTLTAPDGTLLASAVKRSAFRREFVVSQPGRPTYVLKAVAPVRREFGLYRGDVQVGSIVPVSWWRRRARVEFNENLPRPVEAFFVWLTLLLWKRDAEAAS